MTITNFYRKNGGYSKEMLMYIYKWAKVLGADEMTIFPNGKITLTCKDGCICNRYKPTTQELKKAWAV